MEKKGVEERHSKTALITALYRAMAHGEFRGGPLGPDHLAARFLPAYLRFLVRFGVFRAMVIKKSDRVTPGVYAYTLARTAFFDSVYTDALKEGVPQIVLLGAGYDTRGFRFRDAATRTRVFELDIATTQSRKLTCLERAGIDIPGHLTLVPIDFNRDSLKEVLEEAGADLSRKTVFLWEGVSYYLEPAAAMATLDFVGALGHSRIAFDYGVTFTEETMDQYYGVRTFMAFWKRHRANEPFKFLIDDGDIEPFLKDRGMRLMDHMDNRSIEEQFLTDTGGKLLGHTLGSLRFAVAASKDG